MRFKLKVIGPIKKDIKMFEARLKRATKNAAVAAAAGLKTELRAQVHAAGLGKKVADAWRSAADPKHSDSLNSVARVWSKAPHIISAFDTGTVIHTRNKKYLAIPSEHAPKRGLGDKKISPHNWPEHRFGKLYFIKGKGGKAVYVVHSLRKSFSRKTNAFRGYRLASESWKKKRTVESVVMFYLVDLTNPGKRLDVMWAARKWAAKFPRLIDSNMSGKT